MADLVSGLGLSEAQVAERRLRLHAGDAADVLSGNWRALWRRKKGLNPEADLSGEFRVQLGSYTEPFNLAWTMRETGRMIDYYSANPLMRTMWEAICGRPSTYEANEVELQVSKTYPFLACNLDGMTTTPQGHRCPIDAKHVGSSDYNALVLRYTPAGVHQATVMDCDYWALSVIAGNKWMPPIYQEVDPAFQADYLDRCRAFWQFVVDNVEPEDMAPVLAPKPQPRLRTIDVPLNTDDPVFAALMQRENWLPEMVEAMGVFAQTNAAAKRNAISRKDMDRLMPNDVGQVTRGRIKAKRDGRGFSATLAKEQADG